MTALTVVAPAMTQDDQDALLGFITLLVFGVVVWVVSKRREQRRQRRQQQAQRPPVYPPQQPYSPQQAQPQSWPEPTVSDSHPELEVPAPPARDPEPEPETPSAQAEPPAPVTPAPVAPAPKRRSTPAAPRPARPQPPPAPTQNLLAYGGDRRKVGRGAQPGSGLFAVVDLETTSLSPHTGRVIEVAVAVTTGDGTVVDEFASLVHPPGIRSTGAVDIHGITLDDLQGAPTFDEVMPEVLARFDYAVVLAHNATFENGFLTQEFARAMPGHGWTLPSLDSLWLARATQVSRPDVRNNRLKTLCQHYGVYSPDAHAALGDVRMLARLMPYLLEEFDDDLVYPCPTLSLPGAAGVVSPRTRAVAIRKGRGGWMASVMDRLPASTMDVSDADGQSYLYLVSSAMEDNDIDDVEAGILADYAGSLGLGAAQMRALHEQFLEGMRESALTDQTITADEVKTLKKAASVLGVRGYFDDLRPTSTAARPEATPRKCGHCRQPGHTRRTCPELT